MIQFSVNLIQKNFTLFKFLIFLEYKLVNLFHEIFILHLLPKLNLIKFYNKMLRVFRKSSNLYNIVKRTYDQKVINYFENPPNVGSLDKNSPNVGTCKNKITN